MRETGSKRVDANKILSIRLSTDGLYFYTPRRGKSDEVHRLSYPVGSGDGAKAAAVNELLDSTGEGDAGVIQIFIDVDSVAYFPAELMSIHGGAVDARTGDEVPSREMPTDCKSTSEKAMLEKSAPEKPTYKKATCEKIVPESHVPEKSAYIEQGREEFLSGELARAGVVVGRGEEVVVSPSVAGVCAVMCYDAEVISALRTRFGQRAVFLSPLHENIELATMLAMSSGAIIANITENNIYVTVTESSGIMTVVQAYPCATEADAVYYIHELTASGTSRGSSRYRGRIYLYGPRAEAYARKVKRYFRNVRMVLR